LIYPEIKVSRLLTYIQELVLHLQEKIAELANIDPGKTRTNDLTTEETVALRQTLEESDLKL
jgi:ribosomal protein S13